MLICFSKDITCTLFIRISAWLIFTVGYGPSTVILLDSAEASQMNGEI